MTKITRFEINSDEFRELLLRHFRLVGEDDADIRIVFDSDGQFIRPENAMVLVEFKEITE